MHFPSGLVSAGHPQEAAACPGHTCMRQSSALMSNAIGFHVYTHVQYGRGYCISVVLLARFMFGQGGGGGGRGRETMKKQELLSPSGQLPGIPMKSVQHRPR